MIAVELRRALHRRLVWVIAGVVALIGFASAGIMLVSVTPDTAANRQVAYEKAHADWEANHVQWEADCREQVMPKDMSPDHCVIPEPTLSDNGTQFGLTSLGNLVGELPAWITFLASVGAFVAAASLIGAEHSTRNLQTWLTFVPDRTRVFLAKLVPAAAVGLFMLAVSTVSVLGTIAVSWLIRVHSLAGIGAAGAGLGRGLLVVLVAALCGFAVASLGRHTGIALAAAGLLFPLSYFLIIVAELTHSSFVHRLAPSSNLIALVMGKYDFMVSLNNQASEWPPPEMQTVTAVQGGLYWALIALLLAATALAVFRRRDLT